MGIMDGLVHLRHCRICGFLFVDGRCLHERLGVMAEKWLEYMRQADAKRERERGGDDDGAISVLVAGGD